MCFFKKSTDRNGFECKKIYLFGQNYNGLNVLGFTIGLSKIVLLTLSRKKQARTNFWWNTSLQNTFLKCVKTQRCFWISCCGIKK